ncbi:MAG: ATP-binding cassette domain-containing protein [Oscillospiraceae bacterium]|nr:ATP-binding cassette domain-containing protein [Oscillospiraceae bacterium]
MIEMKGISKSYRVRRREAGLQSALRSLFSHDCTKAPALREMTFTIPDGQIVGYIGPNGAGKSTTIKILCGILRPDSGTCTVDGLTPWADRKRHVARLGVVFGQRSQLWWDVPVMESFLLLRDIYGVPAPQFQANLDRLTELLDLSELLRTPARMLSLGQRMRCEIAAALLHSPRVLFLDEPTIGLDAVSKLQVREFIREQNRLCGTTVILTTHDMQDIDALCSRVILIGKGQLLLDGTTAQIRAMAGENLSTEESVADLYRRFGI